MFDPPDSLLEELRGAGRVESSGSFTVDRERAAALLARLRFQSPYEYVLKLVQHAVAAGAGQVWVTVMVGGRVSIWYDRAVLTEAELAELARHAMEPVRSGPRRHLTHLAEGLQAAQALDPSFVEVAAVSREQSFRLLRNADSELVERLWQASEAPWTRIRLRGLSQPWLRPRIGAWARLTDCLGSRSLGDLYADFEALRDSEYSQVWRRCLFAPVPVFLNRRLVNRPFFGIPSSVTRSQGAPDIVPAAAGGSLTCCLLAPQPEASCIPVPHALPIWPVAFGGDVRQVRFLDQLVGHRPTSVWRLCQEFPSDPDSWEELPVAGDTRLVAFGHSLVAGVHLAFVGVPPPEDPTGRLHVWGGATIPAHAVLTRRAPGWLALVRDGVVLSRLEPVSPGWQAICRADGLDVDLSGLEVVRNQKFEAVLETLAAAASLASG